MGGPPGLPARSACAERSATSAFAAREVRPTPTMLKNPWIWSSNLRQPTVDARVGEPRRVRLALVPQRVEAGREHQRRRQAGGQLGEARGVARVAEVRLAGGIAPVGEVHEALVR